MANTLTSDKVAISKRVSLIAAFPCFASFKEDERRSLAELMQVIQFEKGEAVVKQDELVDSIYLLVEGSAEVTIAKKDKLDKLQDKLKVKLFKANIPIARLQSGEAIGLNDTGFYSETGKRTATVTALSPLLTLRLDVKSLHQFLKEHQLEHCMLDASSQMLKALLIKRSLPFSQLTIDRMQWLSERVVESVYEDGVIIFKKGDPGDRCYLIKNGQVEIVDESYDSENILATLSAPALFGEATLITRERRNATARAKGHLELLVIEHSYLTELMESEKNVARMFMTLMVDRSRPSQNPFVTKHERQSADKQTIIILKNTENGSYFKLSKEGDFIWDQLDGKHTLREITIDMAKEFNVFAPNVVTALISKLTKNGFVMNVQVDNEMTVTQSLWKKRLTKLFSFLDCRLALGDADPWVTRYYERYVKYLFYTPAIVIQLFIMLLGIATFAWTTPLVLQVFKQQHSALFLVLCLIPLSLLRTVIHELSHAFAVKANKREVHYIGVGWQWVQPIAFTDTSDMWLASRKSRILVNFAGIYTDIFLACFVSIFIIFIPNHYIQSVLWVFALYVFIGGFRMLSPLTEQDGYYILMDFLEKNHLRQSAIVWLVQKFPKIFKQPKMIYVNKAEVIYWIACIIYLILVSVFTLTVQSFFFSIFNIKVNLIASLLMPIVMMFISSISVIAELKQQSF